MYGISTSGKPEGVLNDYDLASWDKFPTTNSDRTGTVPFMALDMLNSGLEKRIPRLYRHDAESFIWVLTYITLVSVQYKGRFIKISRPQSLNSWFALDHEVHLSSKQGLPGYYGLRFPVTESHQWHLATTRSLIEYWVRFDISTYGKPVEQEIDDPKGALESLIKGVEVAFGGDVADEFKKLKVKLRKVTGTSEAE
jgi:hypothetical protein